VIGKTAVLPFLRRARSRIVGDGGVDAKFGTGAVKVTPAHEPERLVIGQGTSYSSSRSW
jgi:valyl-tRNA synthetase